MSSIQWFTAGVGILVVAISVLRIKSNPEKTFIRVPIILLMAHVIVFYAFLFIRDNTLLISKNYLMTDWSSVLRLHSLLTYLLLEGYGLRRDIEWKKLIRQQLL